MIQCGHLSLHTPRKAHEGERFGSGLIMTPTSASSVRQRYPQVHSQRINVAVFRHPEQVMENVEVVTTHIVSRLLAEGVQDPYAVTPALIPTRYGRSFHRDDSGSYWRMLHYIETGTVFDTSRTYGMPARLAAASEVPVACVGPATKRLHDTLPGFHHTPKYLKEFDDVVNADVKNRARR